MENTIYYSLFNFEQIRKPIFGTLQYYSITPLAGVETKFQIVNLSIGQLMKWKCRVHHASCFMQYAMCILQYPMVFGMAGGRILDAVEQTQASIVYTSSNEGIHAHANMDPKNKPFSSPLHLRNPHAA